MRLALRRTVIALGLLIGALPITSHAQIERGDLAWSRRAETLVGDRARPEHIESAIEAYRVALDSDAGSLEATWKLLRALHYAIEFTTLGEERQQAHLDAAISIAEKTSPTTVVTDQTPGDSSDERADRARLSFWSAIAWGARAQRVGLLTIVREGVATRMHDHAERALALDPAVDRGGPLRLLSRLHATLPRVPFVSGWVDRDRALPLAERAFALDAAHPGNRLVLALALLEGAEDREARALNLLRSVADSQPRPEALVEDLAIRKQAAEELAARVGPDA